MRWREKGEIRNDDYTVHYSANVVKKIVYNDRIIAVKVRVKPIKYEWVLINP